MRAGVGKLPHAHSRRSRSFAFEVRGRNRRPALQLTPWNELRSTAEPFRLDRSLSLSYFGACTDRHLLVSSGREEEDEYDTSMVVVGRRPGGWLQWCESEFLAGVGSPSERSAEEAGGSDAFESDRDHERRPLRLERQPGQRLGLGVQGRERREQEGRRDQGRKGAVVRGHHTPPTDEKAYVTNMASGTVSVIDGQQGR